MTPLRSGGEGGEGHVGEGDGDVPASVGVGIPGTNCVCVVDVVCVPRTGDSGLPACVAAATNAPPLPALAAIELKAFAERGGRRGLREAKLAATGVAPSWPDPEAKLARRFVPPPPGKDAGNEKLSAEALSRPPMPVMPVLSSLSTL